MSTNVPSTAKSASMPNSTSNVEEMWTLERLVKTAPPVPPIPNGPLQIAAFMRTAEYEAARGGYEKFCEMPIEDVTGEDIDEAKKNHALLLPVLKELGYGLYPIRKPPSDSDSSLPASSRTNTPDFTSTTELSSEEISFSDRYASQTSNSSQTLTELDASLEEYLTQIKTSLFDITSFDIYFEAYVTAKQREELMAKISLSQPSVLPSSTGYSLSRPSAKRSLTDPSQQVVMKRSRKEEENSPQTSTASTLAARDEGEMKEAANKSDINEEEKSKESN